MRNTFDEVRFNRGGSPIYQRPRRAGRILLYLLSFMLGAMTTIALSFVINPALVQSFLELFTRGVAFIIATLLNNLVLFIITSSSMLIFLYVVVDYQLLNNKREGTNITVDIEGKPVSIDNLSKEEADSLAEQFKSLHPKVSGEE